MSNITIINHSGATNRLPKPVEEGGKIYPFIFHAANPEERRWSYRMFPSDPKHLTDERLIQLFEEARRTLRADWEEQVGHPVGFLTIYLPSKDGKADECKTRFDQGPELGPDLRPVGPSVKPQPPQQAPKSKEPEPEMGW